MTICTDWTPPPPTETETLPVLLVQHFDPYLDMPDIESDHATVEDAVASIRETLAYWEGMVGDELGSVTHITLNSDPAGTTFYMVFHEGTDSASPVQTDTFTIGAAA